MTRGRGAMGFLSRWSTFGMPGKIGMERFEWCRDRSTLVAARGEEMTYSSSAPSAFSPRQPR